MATKRREPQAARSAAMRARLVAAAKRSLMESGYGRTTAVEVCARAGVTRGALFHHFADLSALYAAVLNEVAAAMGARNRDARSTAGTGLTACVDTALAVFGHPDFKIVIEIWLAARNDPQLRRELDPVIQRIRRAASPELNPDLAEKVGRSAEQIAFYRLIVEAMIGMALGRAVSPGGKPLAHADSVIALLRDMARERDTRGKGSLTSPPNRANKALRSGA